MTPSQPAELMRPDGRGVGSAAGHRRLALAPRTSRAAVDTARATIHYRRNPRSGSRGSTLRSGVNQLAGRRSPIPANRFRSPSGSSMSTIGDIGSLALRLDQLQAITDRGEIAQSQPNDKAHYAHRRNLALSSVVGLGVSLPVRHLLRPYQDQSPCRSARHARNASWRCRSSQHGGPSSARPTPPASAPRSADRSSHRVGLGAPLVRGPTLCEQCPAEAGGARPPVRPSRVRRATTACQRRCRREPGR